MLRFWVVVVLGYSGGDEDDVRRRSNSESDSAVIPPNHSVDLHEGSAVAIGIAETITPVGPVTTRDTPMPPPEATAPTLSGRVIGDYVLGDVIGSGGMGVIYTATDSKLHRKVAIKVIHAHLESVVADYASS